MTEKSLKQMILERAMAGDAEIKRALTEASLKADALTTAAIADYKVRMGDHHTEFLSMVPTWAGKLIDWPALVSSPARDAFLIPIKTAFGTIFFDWSGAGVATFRAPAKYVLRTVPILVTECGYDDGNAQAHVCVVDTQLVGVELFDVAAAMAVRSFDGDKKDPSSGFVALLMQANEENGEEF